MIRVENLTKYYGDVCPIKDVDFTVHDGEILGFLGPVSAYSGYGPVAVAQRPQAAEDLRGSL